MYVSVLLPIFQRKTDTYSEEEGGSFSMNIHIFLLKPPGPSILHWKQPSRLPVWSSSSSVSFVGSPSTCPLNAGAQSRVSFSSRFPQSPSHPRSHQLKWLRVLSQAYDASFGCEIPGHLTHLRSLASLAFCARHYFHLDITNALHI